jgi:hypothetical protein
MLFPYFCIEIIPNSYNVHCSMYRTCILVQNIHIHIYIPELLLDVSEFTVFVITNFLVSFLKSIHSIISFTMLSIHCIMSRGL